MPSTKIPIAALNTPDNPTGSTTNNALHSLHEKIELVTGLKAEQQRLIYRGRIINSNSSSGSGGGGPANTPRSSISSRQPTEVEALLGDATSVGVGVPSSSTNNTSTPSTPSPSTNNTTTASTNNNTIPRVRDVNGLCDQQTIHLVPRPHASSHNSTHNANNNNNNNSSTSANASMGGTGTGGGGIMGGIFGGALGGIGDGSGGGNATTTNVTSLSGEAGMSLLAALLGVSGASGGGGGGNGGGGNTTNGGGVEVASRGATGSTTEGGGPGGMIERVVMIGVFDDGPPPLISPPGNAAITALGGGGALLAALNTPDNPAGSTTNNATANRNTNNATATRNTHETFPRLAPLGNTARRTMSRRNRNSSASSAAARARAQAARLTEADLRVADPGGGEPVRQGLMTLYTLLGGAGVEEGDSNVANGGTGIATERETGPASVRAPLDSDRQWYRGQWLDALDTVNQWLEATVVDIVLPSDILPSYQFKNGECGDNDEGDNAHSERGDGKQGKRRTRRTTPDAVVSANDLEGRRRLLLEPLPEIPETNDDDDEHRSDYHHGGGGAPSHLLDEHYRPRPDNSSHLQLLLIHYNGWPHRWDEWIRSDSERLRPFRTRTRHRSTTVSACPTPTAVFPASPSTVIRDEEDAGLERMGMLMELGRVVGGVNGLLNAAVGDAGGGGMMAEEGSGSLRFENGSARYGSNLTRATDTSHLPWRPLPPPHHHRHPLIASLLSSPEDGDGYEDMATSFPPRPDPRSLLDGARLRQLAPLLDRLGRTLMDAAPHIAALADSLPSPHSLSSNNAAADNNNATSYAAAVAGTAPMQEEDPIQSLAARASHLYFGIGSDDNDEDTPPSTSFQRSTTLDSTATVEQVVEEQTTTIIDPDLTDYIDGMVNTSRGSNGGLRNSDRENNRGVGSGDPLGSSLLASYLSSMGGTLAGGGGMADSIGGGGGGGGNNNENTRVIRMGGGNGGGLGGLGGGMAGGGAGPGIDIHIHAIVTGPGMANAGGIGGGSGGFMMDGGGIAAMANTGGGGGNGGGGATASSRNNNGSSLINHAAFGTTFDGDIYTNDDEDDTDLFSELYSESPTPVNLHGEDDTRIVGISENNSLNEDLSQLFEECQSIEEDDEGSDDGTNEEEVEPTEAEVMLAMLDSIPCVEADSIISASPLHASVAAALAMEGELANITATIANANSNGSSSSGSLLALSEIESQESTATVPPPPSSSATGSGGTPTTTPTTPAASALSSMQMGVGGGSNRSNSSISSSSRSPSFGNRLFRRTLGRLSGSSSRRGGSSSSSSRSP